MSNQKPSLPNALFVDDKVNIYEGEDAAKLIAAKANQIEVDSQRGVVKVDKARWQEAQRYERTTWLERASWKFDDRNEYHYEHFARYAVLRNREFLCGIELGCGPFTNIRFILEHCKVKTVHLLDPLIGDYLSHRFCKYRRRHLGGFFNDYLICLPGYAKRFRMALRTKINDWRIGGMWGNSVTIEESMIETYETTQRFDLVVMINVIEHCQDVMAIFKKIDEILLPGGVFVYHDKMYQAEEVKNLSKILYDAGHPLLVDQSVIEEFLKDFVVLMRAEYAVDREFKGLQTQQHELYFIGQKKLQS